MPTRCNKPAVFFAASNGMHLCADCKPKEQRENPTVKFLPMGHRLKPRIRKNAWDNWYAYLGTQKVLSFLNTSEQTQEQQAREWLAEQNKPKPPARCDRPVYTEQEIVAYYKRRTR